MEKRMYEESSEDETRLKKQKLPGLTSVIVEALKVDSLQRLCSALEPLLRRIVSEEVERALTKLGHAELAEKSSPPRIQGPLGNNLQLHFKTKMSPHLFTGGKIEGEKGAPLQVILLEASTGNVVQVGPESAAKLNVVVLGGDFNEEIDNNWTREEFEGHEVREREGKRPLLTGDLQVNLKEGVGILGDLSFTDNSSWIRSRKFRIGVKVAKGYCDGVRVREAKSEAFAVKDHRGELYKKHYPPVLHDEVWRLDRIAKDGALHKKLLNAEVITVEDFLKILVKEPQRLRSILGSGMSNKMWENTVEHAKTCVLGEKLFVYYANRANSLAAVFDEIYELRGLIDDGQFFPLESLTHDQKISMDSLMKEAYGNWNQVIEYDSKVLNSLSVEKKNKPLQNSQLIEFPFITSTDEIEPTATLDFGSVAMAPFTNNSYFEGDFSEDIRLRSLEMLEGPDMQRLLKSFSMGSFGNANESCYSYDVSYEDKLEKACESKRGRAVVGWIKLKAALRWGIFVRKRAAERRAQLVQLD